MTEFRKINICFLNLNKLDPTKGGIERVSYNLIRAFQAMGHHVVVVYGVNNKGDSYEFVEQYELPYKDAYHNAVNVNFLHSILERENIQILLNQASFISSMFDLSIEAKRGTHVKLVTTLHTDPQSALKELTDKFDYIRFSESGYISILSKQLFRLIKYPLSVYLRKKTLVKCYRKMYHCSDAYVLLSESFIRPFILLTQLKNPSKLYAINNPIVIDSSEDFVERKNQLLFVGRMNYQKRVDRLLEIWCELYKDFPNWELMLLGDGEAVLEMKSYAKKLKLERVHFLGKRDPEPFYKESKILCMTSSYEGFGMVLAEAQQHGCIPIAYDSFGSLKDIIDEGENGYRIPPFKQKQYIEKLCKLINDEPLREKMSLKAMQTCKRFDVKIIAQEWQILFNRIIKDE